MICSLQIPTSSQLDLMLRKCSCCTVCDWFQGFALFKKIKDPKGSELVQNVKTLKFLCNYPKTKIGDHWTLIECISFLFFFRIKPKCTSWYTWKDNRCTGMYFGLPNCLLNNASHYSVGKRLLIQQSWL